MIVYSVTAIMCPDGFTTPAWVCPPWRAGHRNAGLSPPIKCKVCNTLNSARLHPGHLSCIFTDHPMCPPIIFTSSNRACIGPHNSIRFSLIWVLGKSLSVLDRLVLEWGYSFVLNALAHGLKYGLRTYDYNRSTVHIGLINIHQVIPK